MGLLNISLYTLFCLFIFGFGIAKERKKWITAARNREAILVDNIYYIVRYEEDKDIIGK